MEIVFSCLFSIIRRGIFNLPERLDYQNSVRPHDLTSVTAAATAIGRLSVQIGHTESPKIENRH